MRALIAFILLLLAPVLAQADVRWHKFEVGRGSKEPITLGRVVVVFELQKDQTSGFPDDILMTVKTPGQKPNPFYFTSSYYGSVAIHENVLLLKYGVGRGTPGARVDRVKALRLDHDLEELADVQCSYWRLTNRHNAEPDLFEYQLKIRTGGGYTALSFSLPRPRYGLPSEKMVRWKNDG
jgi:hypothetical protein